MTRRPPAAVELTAEEMASLILSALEANSIEVWSTGMLGALGILRSAGVEVEVIDADSIAACIKVKRGRRP